MDPIKLYTINKDLETVEQGDITLDKACEVIDRYIALQSQPTTSGEACIAQSLFGFCVDTKTFIEIGMETEEEYRIKFERPGRRKLLFLSIPSLYQKEIKITGKRRLIEVVSQFFRSDLQSFEDYFDAL